MLRPRREEAELGQAGVGVDQQPLAAVEARGLGPNGVAQGEPGEKPLHEPAAARVAQGHEARAPPLGEGPGDLGPDEDDLGPREARPEARQQGAVHRDVGAERHPGEQDQPTQRRHRGDRRREPPARPLEQVGLGAHALLGEGGVERSAAGRPAGLVDRLREDGGAEAGGARAEGVAEGLDDPAEEGGAGRVVAGQGPADQRRHRRPVAARAQDVGRDRLRGQGAAEADGLVHDAPSRRAPGSERSTPAAAATRSGATSRQRLCP